MRNILLVDDDPSFCEFVAAGLERHDYVTRWSTHPEDAVRLIREFPVQACVIDINMPGRDGLSLCDQLARERPEVPVVLVTGFGNLDNAVAALRAGACDFLTKPFDIDRLVMALNRAVEIKSLRDEVRRLKELVEPPGSSGPIVGASPPMLRLFDMMRRIRSSLATVLVVGETGTGKELVARAVHDQSSRSTGPFVGVNCAALPEPILESELFGHKRGAFTDARDDHPGLFRSADGGTLFLDEIGELPMSLQPRLLRAIQERRIRPLGGTGEIPVDIRLICATNRDLEAQIREGNFREDLYFRINVVTLEVPPLRCRGSDILKLAQHLTRIHARQAGKPVQGLTPACARMMLQYRWPGNVRELQNAIERAVILTEHDHLVPEDLPTGVRARQEQPDRGEGRGEDVLLPLAEVERQHILRVLDSVGGSRTEAARILGLDRKTLYRRLLEYGKRP